MAIEFFLYSPRYNMRGEDKLYTLPFLYFAGYLCEYECNIVNLYRTRKTIFPSGVDDLSFTTDEQSQNSEKKRKILYNETWPK